MRTNGTYKRCIRPDKLSQLCVDRTLAPPLDERIKQQSDPLVSIARKTPFTNSLITPIRVLFPPIKLIITRERHALFESPVRIGCPADRVAFQLQTQRHVKILGHVRLGPNLSLLVGGVDKSSVLESFPAEKSAWAWM